MSAYAELHCHSTFSLGDGASTPEALVERAAELGYGALALTDHDDLGGAVRFAAACETHGVHPVFGAELTLEDDSHLTVLVESDAGWRNLSSLITASRMERPRGEPAISLARLEAHAAGLVALSGCPRGRLPTLLRMERPAQARDAAADLRDLFGGRLYLEIGDHRTRGEASLAADLFDLATDTGLPWVVTHDVHYATRAQRRVHDLLVATRARMTLAEAERRGVLRPSAEWCLQPPEIMAGRWRTRPEGIRRTLEIAERCRFDLRGLRPELPAFPVPAGFADAATYLEHLARAGLAERLPGASERHHRQLDHELGIIRRLGIPDPFLIVWDLCRFAREGGVLCQGRGSAANSLVCYALRVTAVDPVANDLLFERFVSLERPELPDIDIDFPSGTSRESVLQYVYARYGRAHAAMACVATEYLGRSAIRDAMRALGRPLPDADRLAKGLSAWTDCTRAAEWLVAGDGAALRDVGIEPASARGKALVSLVRGLHGVVRQRSIHPGGFVLSREPIGGVFPVEPAAMPERTVITLTKDDLETAGILKFDLLGLGMLDLLSRCLHSIRATRGVELDIGTIPLDDPQVYAQVRDADTIGLFQIESRAQANFLPRLRPTCFYDLVISVGAIRPGPMLGGQVKEMLARRRGEVATEYPHPDLEPVLKRTYGMALFQEQLMRCAITVSGCTAGEADRLRRAMTKKRSRAEMDAATGAIQEGMRQRGVDSEGADRVMAWLSACAAYTFPESHSISFALLAYASAYLRHRFAPEYLAAILNAQPMGFYPVATLVHDAQDHGVEVRPLDCAHSEWNCTLEPREGEEAPAVRIGIRYTRGLGPRAGKRVQAALEAGPFRSLADLIDRAELGDAEVRALASAGAFRSWVPGGRRDAVWAALGVLRERRTGGPLAPTEAAGVAFPALSPVRETLAESRTTGIMLEGHAMAHLRTWLDARGVIPTATLCDGTHAHGERVTVAGLVIVRQRPGTAKGFVFLGLEDETGRIDVIVTPTLYERERGTINGSGILAVRGKLGREDGVTNLKAERFFAVRLEDATEVVVSHDYH